MSEQESEALKKCVEILGKSAGIASVRDIEHSDALLVLGEDPVNTAPRLALAAIQASRQKPIEEIAKKLKIPVWLDQPVRNAVQDAKGPIINATPFATSIDTIATISHRAAPDDLARLGFAIANALNDAAPSIDGLTPGQKDLAKAIAQMLSEAKRPTVIAGATCGSIALLEAAADVYAALSDVNKAGAKICLIVPDANSLGLAMFGAGNLEDASARARQGLDAVIVLENDLYRRASSKAVDALFSKTRVISLDSLENETIADADIVLPCATFAESQGTLINNEGRAQRYFKVLPPKNEVRRAGVGSET